VVLVVVLSIFAGSLTPAVLPLGIILSAPATRVVRSATLSARNELFVDAARVSGLSRRQIITRHILPRVAGPVIVQSTLLAAVALTTIASLAFLGLGVRPPAPTWGSMVAEAAQVYQTQPMYLLVCGGLIALTVLAFGLLGEAIGDSMSERWAASGAHSRPSRRRPAPVAVDGPANPHAVPEAPAALRVSGLTVSFPWAYDGRNVVEDVSFSVAAGETVALVGESGSGKSVTARALLGLLPGGTEISGSAALNGRELLSLSERELTSVRGSQIALISQDPVLSLDPCYTVGKSLRDVVRLHSPVSRRAADAEAATLLERVHIPDPGVVLGRYPHQLSGGMAQRVAIARALAGKPEVLIADEPTTALDVTVQNRILELLFELQESTGIAIVLITHDWGVVATIADRALTMYAGQIVEAAAAEKVFGQPLHPYTAALLRSSPYFSPVGKRLPVVAGSVPTPDEFPRGCRFSNRCPLAVDECREGPIDLREVAGLHDSRCIRTEALLTLEASPS
jgi:peptide/nickel transport system permease protein